jgi:prepilin peptidase CpaA
MSLLAERLLAWAPMLLVLGVAARTDLQSRRIPNSVCLTLILLGLLRAVMALAGSASGAWPAVGPGVEGASYGSFGPLMMVWEGVGVGVALTLLFYLVGALGAGDLKLMAGVGACMGPVGVVQVFVVTAIVAMVMTVAMALMHGKVVALARSATVALFNLVYISGSKIGSLSEARQDCPSVGAPLPYALPVLVGAIVIACLRHP